MYRIGHPKGHRVQNRSPKEGVQNRSPRYPVYRIGHPRDPVYRIGHPGTLVYRIGHPKEGMCTE